MPPAPIDRVPGPNRLVSQIPPPQPDRPARAPQPDPCVLLMHHDTREARALTQYLAGEGYDCVVAASCEEGLQEAVAGLPVAAVIGVVSARTERIGLLAALRALRACMPILLVTERAAVDSATDPLRLWADDYLCPPVSPQRMGERLAIALGRRRMSSQPLPQAGAHSPPAMSENGRRVLRQSAKSICNALEPKDVRTRGHSHRVAEVAQVLAVEMGLSAQEVEVIRLQALLHDIGKIGIPEDVLTSPQALTDEQWDRMKQHPEIGFRILCPLVADPEILDGVRHHHERIDGCGYPHGLIAREIGLGSRIIAVADGYDAMTSPRMYRRWYDASSAIREMRRHAGTQWDGDVVQALFRSFPELTIRRAAATHAPPQSPRTTRP